MVQSVSLVHILPFYFLGENKKEPFEDGLEVKILKASVDLKLNSLTSLLSNQNTQLIGEVLQNLNYLSFRR